jgi:hypothetical protein
MKMSEKYLKSDIVKIKLLNHLKDQKWHSNHDIQKAIGKRYESMRMHLDFLELGKIVKLKVISTKDPYSRKEVYRVKITKFGMGLEF